MLRVKGASPDTQVEIPEFADQENDSGDSYLTDWGCGALAFVPRPLPGQDKN